MDATVFFGITHPAGISPHHGPSFGTEELQQGVATLIDDAKGATPDNGDVPLDSVAHAVARLSD